MYNLEKRDFILKFTGLAFLSGITSLLLEFEGLFSLLIILGAGLIYGLITSQAIKNKYTEKRTVRTWIIFCTTSYLVALFISIQGSSGIFSYIDDYMLFFGGFIGAIILALGFKKIVRQNNETISLFNIILSAIAGGLIPFLIYNLTFIKQDFYTMVLIYTIWPVLISLILANSIKLKSNNL